MRKKRKQKISKKYVSSTRIFIVIVGIVVLVGTIFFRLYYLQIKKHQYFADIADKQYSNRKELLPRRGEIMFKEKDILIPAAVNKDMPTIFVVPSEIIDREMVIQKLSDILNLDVATVRQKVFKKNDPYEVIKKKTTKIECENVKKENLQGVYFEQERWRYYPGNELAAQTLGFLGYNKEGVVGRYGIEQQFDEILSGKKGFVEEDSDARGRWISIGKRIVNPSMDGSKLVLSLNSTIQFKIETALTNAVKKHGADGGKIIVINPKNGKILAMASNPTFNSNEYSKAEVSIFRNPIISDTYEPGSVFKIITMAAGLDSGRISPNTTYVDTGLVRVAGFDIKNSDEKAYGKQTMTEVIEKSLNTGVIFVEKVLGNTLFASYVDKFGFGERTGINLPGEARGNVRNLKTKRDVNFYTASYGQGVSVTPLQLAMSYGVIANQGVLMKPSIIDTIKSSSGQKKEIKPTEIRQVISKESAWQAALMLESNIQNGHGKLADVPGYRIGGKTGTAQIPDRENGGYVEGATIGTFAGFAPIDEPAFVMVVIIDHPRDTEWAAGTAAPVFGELSKFLLNYFSVEPTEEYSTEDLEIFDKKHNYLDTVVTEEDDSGDNENN
jgi:cell division protein FtsI/penicillin-binding protein 2